MHLQFHVGSPQLVFAWTSFTGSTWTLFSPFLCLGQGKVLIKQCKALLSSLAYSHSQQEEMDAVVVLANSIKGNSIGQ